MTRLEELEKDRTSLLEAVHFALRYNIPQELREVLEQTIKDVEA